MSETVASLLAFKQIEEDRLYAAVKVTVAREEAEAAEAAAKAEEEGKSQSQSKSNRGKSPSPAIEQVDASQGDDVAANDAVRLEQTPEKLERRESKLSKTGSQMPGTSRSRKKGAEYTRASLIKLWEEMETAYMRDGLIALSNIQAQRQSVCDNLNDCQRKFIDFLERPCVRQEKINEFVESLNQFSLEYPDLRSDEQTKDELQSRLEKLSNSLWDVTNVRKEEAIGHIETMSRTGWAYLEMKQLCKNMAALVEIEIKKFATTYQVIAKQEPPIELDAEIFTKKALERGVQPYDYDSGSSPVLQQMFMHLLAKANELLYKEPIHGLSNPAEQVKILKQEHAIFAYRLAFIYTLSLVTLEEIQSNASLVYQRLDDWIVTALQEESMQSQEVTDMLKASIANEQLQIDEFSAQMSKLDVASRVECMVFRNDEKPLYMQGAIPITEDDVTAHRFSVEQLSTLFKELKYNAGARGHRQFVESTTFTNIIFKAVKKGLVPLAWRYYDYSRIAGITRQFERTPFSAGKSQPTALLQEGKTDTSAWVDWKQALLSFALLKSSVPSAEEVAQLKEQLLAGPVNQAAFQKTPLWFDKQEGKPDPDLKAQWIEELRIASVDDEFEDELDPESLEAEVANKYDHDRLAAIKALIFDIYRAPTGEDKLRPDGLIQAVQGLGDGLRFEDVAMGV